MLDNDISISLMDFHRMTLPVSLVMFASHTTAKIILRPYLIYFFNFIFSKAIFFRSHFVHTLFALAVLLSDY